MELGWKLNGYNLSNPNMGIFCSEGSPVYYDAAATLEYCKVKKFKYPDAKIIVYRTNTNEC